MIFWFFYVLYLIDAFILVLRYFYLPNDSFIVFKLLDNLSTDESLTSFEGGIDLNEFSEELSLITDKGSLCS